MPNITFNIPLYLTGITTYIYTELAPKLSLSWLERWSGDPWSRVQFSAGGLGVAFFATGPRWILKF